LNRVSGGFYLFSSLTVIVDTSSCLKDFVEELSLWSDVVITEIYPSDEPVEDTSSYPLYEEIGSRNKFFYSDKEKLFQDLPNILNGYDIVLFAGLGSIGNWAEEFYTENSTKS